MSADLAHDPGYDPFLQRDSQKALATHGDTGRVTTVKLYS